MKSIRDIYKIGKGPSSSHTIGPERAAMHFKQQHPDAEGFRVDLFGSLSKTGKGHGTDRVLREVLSPLPTEIVFREDEPADIKHPNTMDFFAIKNGDVYDSLRVESIGGGDIRFAGYRPAELSDVYPEGSFAEIEQFCRFRGTDLGNIQGLVVQTGDILRNQSGDGNAGTFTQMAGEFIYGQGGGCNLCRFLGCCASGQGQQGGQNQ